MRVLKPPLTANTFDATHSGCDHCCYSVFADNRRPKIRGQSGFNDQTVQVKITSCLFFPGKLLCFLHVFRTRYSQCLASCTRLLGCVRGVQLFLSVPCIIHGVGGFFFCGLQASWYTRYSFICSWFISSRNVSITLLKLFFPIIRYYSHRRHNPLLLDSVCSLFWVVIE